jgi:hypothetical protein
MNWPSTLEKPAGLSILAAAAALVTAVAGGGAGAPASPSESIAIQSVSTLYPDKPALNLPYAIAGQGAFTLLVNGTGFASSSVVQWNGSSQPTTFGDGSDLAASVSSALIAIPGKATITIKDTASGAASSPLIFGIASPAAATAGVIALITIATDGSPANGDSLVAPSISETGRYVAFQSNAKNLVPGPASGYQEIYERDTCVGASRECNPATIRITATYDGSPVNAHSRASAISANGRYVAFDSQATNLLPNTDSCGGLSSCVFLRDTCVGALTGCSPSTSLISLTTSGAAAGGGAPSVSSDGRFVDFASQSANLTTNKPTSQGDVFLRDTCHGAPSGCTPSTMIVSLSPASSQGDAASNFPPASDPSGRYVAFASYATNLAPGETAVPGIFLRDTCVGTNGCRPTTWRLDVGANGSQPDRAAVTAIPALSRHGRFAAFASTATNLVANSPCASANACGGGNVYVRDTCFATASSCAPSTELVSVGNDGSVGNCYGGGAPGNQTNVFISADGRFASFGSISTNLTPDDGYPACGWEDIFVRDTCANTPNSCTPSTVRVSVANLPNPGISASAISVANAMSADGHYVVFISAATNLLPGIARNGHAMVYLAKTGF